MIYIPSNTKNDLVTRNLKSDKKIDIAGKIDECAFVFLVKVA